MMENLRTAANNPVIKIIFAIIILSFILTGVGGYLVSGSNYAAKVNDTEISSQQLERAFQEERNRQQAQLGDMFSQLVSTEQGVKQIRTQALNQLIDTILLEQYAMKLGITVSDNQIINAIREEPGFAVDGQFSQQAYDSFLARNSITGESYANYLRKQMIQEQLVKPFVRDSFILDNEVTNAAAILLQSRTIRQATLTLSDAQAKQSTTDEELQAYYAKNKNNFIAPQAIKISFVELDAANIQDNTGVNEQQIQDYYDKNTPRFTAPGKGEYSQITVATQDDANAILDALKNGAEFSALAKEKSTDKLTARNGGVIGWMEDAALVPEIKSANLKSAGQVSEIVKLDNGYAIFRLDAYEPEILKPLAEVKDEVTALVKGEAASKAFFDLQQKASEAAANDNESLVGVEQATGVKAVQTDWFALSKLPDAVNYPELLKALSDNLLFDEKGSSGANSDIITVSGDRAFVIRVDAYRPEAVEPFEKVKGEIEALVKRSKAEAALNAQADTLIAALKEGKGDAALAAAGVKFGEAQTIQRLNPTDPVINAAFTQAHPVDGKPTYSRTIDAQGNIVLVQLDKVIAGNATDQEKTELRGVLRQQMASTDLESLLINLRLNADIDVKNMD
ncbi:peptidylprolyl isomerase [Morganella psychrotolerans]|uniref:peptidylprolyl isomerase n=1 Tax=Morganella psychrotolerans TaxID=368603 RepID=UPI0039AFFD69